MKTRIIEKHQEGAKWCQVNFGPLDWRSEVPGKLLVELIDARAVYARRCERSGSHSM